MEKFLKNQTILVKKRIAKNLKKKINYLYGLIAELFLIFALKRRGFIIAGHRYKNIAGEIDIVYESAKSKQIVFLEVKYRSNLTTCDQFQIVPYSKQQRIVQSAKIFLEDEYPKYKDCFIRFDLCIIDDKLRIHYIKNGWRE